MMWAVVRDGRIASNGQHQLQSEHIQEEKRQKAKEVEKASKLLQNI